MLSILFAALAASAGAFELPLTTTQRAQKLVEQGYERITRGDYSGALNYCEQALKVRGDWAPAYVCRSEARLWLKDPMSDRDARQAMRFDPRSGDPHRLLGLWEFEGGRYASAIHHFTQALELSKLKPEGVTECYYYRARARIKTGDLAGAVEDVDHGMGVLRGVSGSYGDWSFYSLRAEVRRRQGEHAKADADERQVLALIEERLKRHPSEAPELLRRRANSYALLGEFERAADEYGRLLAADKEADPRTALERALALVMAGRYEPAVDALGRVLNPEPRRPLVRRIRALARLAAGDSARAIADLDTFYAATAADPDASAELRKALEDDGGALTELEGWQTAAEPRAPALWGRRALVHEMLLEHDAAMSLAARALAADPDDEAAHLARAAAAVTSGRCAEAVPSFDWLVRLHPERGTLRWFRGECRCRTDDLDGCVSDLRQTTQLERAAKTPAFRLASQYRRWLDHRGAAATAAEMRQGLRFYEHARALGALDVADELGRLQTLVDLSLLQPPAQRRETLRDAESACRRLSREDPEDRQLAGICSQIRRKAGSRTVKAKSLKAKPPRTASAKP